MKRLTNWIGKHPAWTAVNILILALVPIQLAFLPDESLWVPVFGICYAGFLAVWSLAVFGPVPILIVALLMSPVTVRAQESEGGTGGGPFAGCVAKAVAALVIAGGGYVVYKIAKFCQKKFPKDDPQKTNSQPAELNFELGGRGGGPSYAAALNYDNIGSCYDGDCNDQNTPDGSGASGTTTGNLTTFTLTLHLSATNLSCVSAEQRKGSEAVQSWPELVQVARAHGVALTGHSGDFSYALNGQPISAEQSPIKWDSERRVIKVGFGSQPYYTITVERSSDLRQWAPVLKTEIEVGNTIQVQDTNPTSQMFYRYSAELTD